MTELIESYSEKPPEALKKSKVYRALQLIIDEAYDNDCYNIKEKTYNQLKSLIDERLTKDTALNIVRPWTRANRIAALVKKNNIKSIKDKYRRHIRYINTIIKDLNKGINPIESLIFFLKGNELNHEAMIKYLEDYKNHYSLVLELEFFNGALLNPHNLIRHGFFSLFHLGDKLGLEKIGKPTRLHHFVNIITDSEYKKIIEYSLQYNKEEFEKISETHPLYNFIYCYEEPINIPAQPEI